MSKIHIPEGRGAAALQRRKRKGFGAFGYALGILFSFLMLPVAVLAFAFVVSFEREISAPSWLRDYISQSSSALLNGGRVDFDEIGFTFGGDLHPRVRIKGGTLFDASSNRLVRIPELELQVSPRGLLFERKLLVQHLRSNGITVTLYRDHQGAIDIDFGQEGNPAAAPKDTPAIEGGIVQLLEDFDSLFEQPLFAALQDVTLRRVELIFIDDLQSRVWRAQDGFLQLLLDRKETEIRGSFDVVGSDSGPAHMSFSYLSPHGSLAVEAGVLMAGIPAADLGREIPPLGWLAPLDAQIGGQIHLTLNEKGEIGETSARVQVSAGRLAPTAAAPAVEFDGLTAALSYDPLAQRIAFEELTFETDHGSLTADGQALLGAFEGPIPTEFVSQLRVRNITLPPLEGITSGVNFPEAAADLRLRLDPFTLEIAQMSLTDPDSDTLRLGGEISAREDGWHAAIDATMAHLPTERLVGLWPSSMQQATRGWLDTNLIGGAAKDLRFSLRMEPEEAIDWSLSTSFEKLGIRAMRALPLIEDAVGTMQIHSNRLAIGLISGHATTGRGQDVDLAGTSFVLDNLRSKPITARVGIEARGQIPDILWLIDQPPFEYLTKANQSVELAHGDAHVVGEISFPLGRSVPKDQIEVGLTAALQNVTSERLVPAYRLSADALSVALDTKGLAISGDVRLADLPASVVWSLPFGTGEGARLTGQAQVTGPALASLGVVLPAEFTGETQAEVSVAFGGGQPPRYRIESDLAGLGITIGAIGASKPRAGSGTLALSGQFAAPLRIDALTLQFPGLSASGSVQMAPEGGLAEAAFGRVRLGTWLDAPVTLRGRGKGRPVGLEVRGGRLSLVDARLGGGGGSGGGGMGPMSLAFDRVEIWGGMEITSVRGDFSSTGGLTGRFTGRLNGGTALQGTVVSQNGRPGVRLMASDAGGLLQSARIFQNAVGGTVDVTLLPTGKSGYSGRLSAQNVQIHDAPVLLQILDGASGLGLAQQAAGQGVKFDTIAADFRIDPGQITLMHGSAAGAGLGISLDGAYTTADRRLNLQGVLSPLYFLNSMGAPLTRSGEGVFGMTFTIGGTTDRIAVGVNPLSLLAPGFLREMFRRPPPQVAE